MSDQTSEPMVVRPTARVLLDRRDRILLMNGRLPGAAGGAWFTIGGGVEPGETYAEAAAREIREETEITDFELGPVVWLRQGVLRLPQVTLLKEQYIVARCGGGEPDRGGWTALERDLVDDIRWWSHGDLARTGERVFPPGLADRLPGVLSGRLPTEPESIPW